MQRDVALSAADWGQAVREAAKIDLARVPPPVLEQLSRVTADTIGVSVAGHREDVMRSLLAADVLGEVAPASECGATVLSPAMSRTGPETAAFLNATAGSFLELDEGMRPTGHPAMHVVPAALAVAETTHSSGLAFARAVLAGYEVTARLFTAYRLRYPVHPHGHFGAVGAAVAAALLSETDPLRAAEVAATTPVLSVWNSCYEGATARNTWMGSAASGGVRATRLARAGFTGSREGLRAAFGEIAGQLVDESVLTGLLDYHSLGITRNYFKRHSACALTHAAIDALLDMDLPHAVDIKLIEVETVENNMKLARQARGNDLSARFSLPYAVAAVAVRGRSDLDTFRYQASVAELARRVDVAVAPDLEQLWPDASPTRVTVHYTGGLVRNQVDNPYGHHTHPITESDLRAKFAQNVGPCAELLWETLTDLSAVSDCATLFDGGREAEHRPPKAPSRDNSLREDVARD